MTDTPPVLTYPAAAKYLKSLGVERATTNTVRRMVEQKTLERAPFPGCYVYREQIDQLAGGGKWRNSSCSGQTKDTEPSRKRVSDDTSTTSYGGRKQKQAHGQSASVQQALSIANGIKQSARSGNGSRRDETHGQPAHVIQMR